MADDKQFVQLMPGMPPVEGIAVTVEESLEKWSEIKLDDGAIIRVKPVVVSVTRVDSHRDQDGNPVYVIKTQPVIAIVKGPEGQP
jgi:hypothetical protein